jgi:predicted  nucleic acid-binding Zn-ribbon protein
MTIDSLAGREQRLVVAAITDDDRILGDDDPEKLLRLPISRQTALDAAPNASAALASDLEQRRNAIARQVNERNLSYFQQEVEKLDAWADDLKVGLEQEIKELDRQIKEVRRTATVAVTLEEKLHWQKQQRELEQRRGRMRRELFDRQNEIEGKRNELIAELETHLQQQAETCKLFAIAWELS